MDTKLDTYKCRIMELFITAEKIRVQTKVWRYFQLLNVFALKGGSDLAGCHLTAVQPRGRQPSIRLHACGPLRVASLVLYLRTISGTGRTNIYLKLPPCTPPPRWTQTHNRLATRSPSLTKWFCILWHFEAFNFLFFFSIDAVRLKSNKHLMSSILKK